MILTFCRRTLVFTLLIVAASCARGVNTTPQIQVAKLGGDLMEAVKVVEQATATLEAQRVIGEAETAQAMGVFYKIGVIGQQLSTALNAYDKAYTPDQRAGVGRDIHATLTMVETLVAQAIIPVKDERARAQLSQLIGNVLKVVVSIRMQIPYTNPMEAAA